MLIFKIVPQIWLDVVRELSKPDFVNLWHADGRREWRRGQPGDKVIMVVGEGREIVGYGTLHSRSPELLSQAWLHHRRKSGVESEAQFRTQVSEIQRKSSGGDLIIGSVFISDPVIFPSNNSFLMQAPLADDTWESIRNDTPGQDLLDRLDRHARTVGLSETPPPNPYGLMPVEEQPSPLLGSTIEATVWRGYRYACGVTRWRTPCTLKIVYIKPLADGGTHEVGNMMLLCLTYAALYEDDLICFNEDGSLVASDLLSEYDKRIYGRLARESLRNDIRPRFRPNLDDVRWRLNRFRTRQAARVS